MLGQSGDRQSGNFAARVYFYRPPMIKWLVLVAIAGLAAGMLAFVAMAGVVASIAKVFFFVFVILFLVLLIAARRMGGGRK